MFLGDVSEERQADIRSAIEDVMSFFDDRYGVVVPEFSLYISPDLEAVASRFGDLTGRGSIFDAGWEGGLATYTPEHGLLGFLAGRYVRDADVQLRTTLAHEYYHLIQHDMLKSVGLAASSPEWLIEGTAEYNKKLYEAHYTGLRADSSDRLLALRDTGSFRDIAEAFSIAHYEIAALAIDWLETHSEHRNANLEFWRSLADSQDPDSAFESAFGITVEDFLGTFESYRTELESAAPRITGVVLDRDDNALDGVNIMASAFARNDGPNSKDVTAADGSFEILVPDGQYVIRLGRVASAAPGTPYSSIFFGLSYSTRTGYANSCGPLTAIEAGTTDLVIKVLPELLEGVDDPPCNEGVPGHYVIESTVFGPDGEVILGDWGRLEGIHVSADPLAFGPFSQGPTGIGTDGRARVAVPNGRYVLEITEYDFGEPRRHVGWHGGESGFTTDRDQATVIEVDGADIAIDIQLPADPEDLPTIE